MQAVSDALSLLANIVMAWNTAKMQAIFDRWAKRRNGVIPPELIARCAPTRLRCERCGSRQVVITFLAPNQRTGNIASLFGEKPS
jgi:hypothetical protein